MNSWSAPADSDGSVVFDLSRIKFYLGKRRNGYLVTNENSIIITTDNRKVFVIAYTSDEPPFKTAIETNGAKVLIKDRVLTIDNETHIYGVSIDEFTKIEMEALYEKPDSFFNSKVSAEFTRKLIEAIKNSKRKNKEGNLDTRFNAIASIDRDSKAIQEEMISKVNKKTLLNVYTNYMDSRVDANERIDDFIKQWAESKENLYIALGRNLEIVVNFEYERNATEIKNDIMESLAKTPIGGMFKYAINEFGYSNLKEFDIKSYDPLYDHTTKREGISISQYLNLYGFEDSNQIKKDVDAILGQSKANGDIHISIDPIAYLMQSVNKHGWTSCHSWIGGTSQGSVSYALDNTSVVTFLCKEKVKYKKGDWVCDGDYQIICPFEWYSMRSRMMVYIDCDSNCFQTSRLYPQGTEWNEFEEKVRYVLEDIIARSCGIENQWTLNRNTYIAESSNGLYNDGANGFKSNVVKHKFYTGDKPLITIGTESYIRNKFTK